MNFSQHVNTKLHTIYAVFNFYFYFKIPANLPALYPFRSHLAHNFIPFVIGVVWNPLFLRIRNGKNGTRLSVLNLLKVEPSWPQPSWCLHPWRNLHRTSAAPSCASSGRHILLGLASPGTSTELILRTNGLEKQWTEWGSLAFGVYGWFLQRAGPRGLPTPARSQRTETSALSSRGVPSPQTQVRRDRRAEPVPHHQDQT